MIDGLTIWHYLKDEDPFFSNVNWHDWYYSSTNVATGKPENTESVSRKFGNLSLRLRISQKGGYLLSITGSLHVFANGGSNNADQLSFDRMTKALRQLHNSLYIDPANSIIRSIEINNTIVLPYDCQSKIIDNLVAYKNKPFNVFDPPEWQAGRVCKMRQYDVKIYRKDIFPGGLGISIPPTKNVLRVEVKVKKMDLLAKYNIVTASDLLDYDKMYQLKDFINDTMSNIIWTDRSVDKAAMSSGDLSRWLALANPLEWQHFQFRKAYKQRKKAAMLMGKYGRFNAKKSLIDYMFIQWDDLFKNTNTIEMDQKKEIFFSVTYLGEGMIEYTDILSLDECLCIDNKAISDVLGIEQRDPLSYGENKIKFMGEAARCFLRGCIKHWYYPKDLKLNVVTAIPGGEQTNYFSLDDCTRMNLNYLSGVIRIKEPMSTGYAFPPMNTRSYLMGIWYGGLV